VRYGLYEPYIFCGEAARVLIQQGAGRDITNQHGQTPLFYAVSRIASSPLNAQEIVEKKAAIAFFLYHGADFETQDSLGLKPYNYAYGNKEIQHMLKNKETVKQSIEWFSKNHSDMGN
jgi:hypothetical protein